MSKREKKGIFGLGLLDKRPKLLKDVEQEKCHQTVPENVSIHMVTVEIKFQSKAEEKRKVVITQNALRRIPENGLRFYWDGKEL